MARKERSDWIRAGLRRLARHGYEGVRIEPLAKDLGVTKGSFYWHFSDRADLQSAMLETWAEQTTSAVIARAESAGPEPRMRLEQVMEIASEGYDAKLELALRDWGSRDAAVRKALDAIDRQRMDYLRKQLRASGFAAPEAEARAFLMYSAALGHQLLPHFHGRYTRERVLREAAKLLTRQI